MHKCENRKSTIISVTNNPYQFWFKDINMFPHIYVGPQILDFISSLFLFSQLCKLLNFFCHLWTLRIVLQCYIESIWSLQHEYTVGTSGLDKKFTSKSRFWEWIFFIHTSSYRSIASNTHPFLKYPCMIKDKQNPNKVAENRTLGGEDHKIPFPSWDLKWLLSQHQQVPFEAWLDAKMQQHGCYT